MHRLGIMGGTFDPIHFGHLVMAEEARRAFALDRVIFVPNGQPPHKKSYSVSSAEDRYAMALLATGSNPFFSCDRIEIERSGPSYTIDTVRHFRECYQDAKDFYFITGADAIMSICSWKNYDQLLRECRFIAVTRPGFALDKLSEIIDPQLLQHIFPLMIPCLEISSTDLRRRIGEGRGIKYLTPDAVEIYIERQGLYHPPVELTAELISSPHSLLDIAQKSEGG